MVVMVRFNPDGYENERKEKIPSPWRVTKHGTMEIKKKWRAAWDARLSALGDTVQYWMESPSGEKMVECIEMYYSAP